MAVMAPLLVGNPENPADPINSSAWNEFRVDLLKAKQKGFTAVSVDVWWGLVQKAGPESFDWAYYDRVLEVLSETQLNWIPILSTHACGGNVGDNCNIPLPEWVWSLGEDTHYVSETQNRNQDYVAHYADALVIPCYRKFWEAFSERYLSSAEGPQALELGLGLGPSGELHYPAYHAHDGAHERVRYPDRGLFQGLGPRADSEFREFLETRYTSSLGMLNRSWETDYSSLENISLSGLVESLNSDLDSSVGVLSEMSQDVLSWYHQSLMDHLERVMLAAYEVFKGQHVIALKIPGVHWHSTRYAELMNGLLDPRDAAVSWKSEDLGLGYARLFATVRDVLDESPAMRVRVYITAAATSDSIAPFSRAETLVRAFSNLAFQIGVPLGIENALAGDLYSESSLQIMESHLKSGRADSVTILRLEDVLRSEVLSEERCRRLLEIR